jgi:hypothetical protein
MRGEPKDNEKINPLARTPVNKAKMKGRGFLAPTPHLSPLWISKHYCYFGPGHFGWLFWLSQGFALPLK